MVELVVWIKVRRNVGQCIAWHARPTGVGTAAGKPSSGALTGTTWLLDLSLTRESMLAMEFSHALVYASSFAAARLRGLLE